MTRRLILDTGVLIASERGRSVLAQTIAEDDDIAIAAITTAELRTVIELAAERHRAARRKFLIRLLETVPVEPYDLETAEAHGRLLAFVHRGGTRRGAHDLMIAATAVATKRVILTADLSARFGELPGVQCLVV